MFLVICLVRISYAANYEFSLNAPSVFCSLPLQVARAVALAEENFLHVADCAGAAKLIWGRLQLVNDAMHATCGVVCRWAMGSPALFRAAVPECTKGPAEIFLDSEKTVIWKPLKALSGHLQSSVQSPR